MYAWVTYGEKEINEIMSTHMIPRCFPTDIPYMENLWDFYTVDGFFIQFHTCLVKDVESPTIT